MVVNIISPYILTILFAWICAHIIKYIVSLYHKERYKLRSHIFRSGGMPSAHSAATVSLATMIGLKDGTSTAVFALAALFALITMYDALKVRRSSGEQGVAIHSLIKKSNFDIELPRIAKGHTPLEVVIGALVGVLVGVISFLSFS